MLTLSQLLQIPNVDNGLRFAISPDEKQIVFSWNKTGSWELWKISPSGMQQLAVAFQGAKFGPKFSPEGSSLAYAVDFDGSESYHILLHNLQNNSIIDLTPNSGYAQQPNFDFSPDGKKLAILSDEQGQFALYLLSIETGEKNLLLDVHRPIWDVAWSPDGKFIAAEAEWQASDRSIFVVEVESGKATQIIFKNEVVNAQHPAWSPDSKTLAFSGENGEWFDIGLFDIESQNISWLNESTGDDVQPAWSRSGDRIGWVHANGAKTSFQFKERGGAIREVKVGDGLHSFPQFVKDGVILLYEDVNHPNDLWKIDLESNKATQLTKSLEENLDFSQPEEILYAGMDGTKIPALLYRAKENKLAVLDIHGGPNWNYSFLWNPLLSYMAQQGWTVLAPNYHGSTGYGKKWQNASRYDMGGVDAEDCAAGARYLLENGFAEKVVVTGRSHGGFLTMCCLTMYPELFAGGSAVVPFLNWIKSHYDSREDLQHWNIENMGDPEENKELWISHSPYFFLDKINSPVQMICGENDPRCPASDSMDARDKMVELGKDVEFLLYKGEGHSFLKIENVIDAETKRMEFLERVLTMDGGR